MRHHRLINAIIVILFFIISGCNIINPAEKIPSFIEIKAMNVVPNATFGSNSSKIKDVWAYADGQFIGAFELPAKFPVLLSGTHEFTFGAGIYNNGISSTRTTYPFYIFDKKTLNLVADQTFKIDTISVSYFPVGLTIIDDDFESSSFSLDTLNTSLAALAFDTTNAFEGKKCLKMQVGSIDSVLECRTNGAPITVVKGSNVYVELNYKADQQFYIGITSSLLPSSKAVLLQINPSATWNKIYVDISQAVLDYNVTATGFQIYFLLQKQVGVSQNTVYLDNLKLVHN